MDVAGFLRGLHRASYPQDSVLQGKVCGTQLFPYTCAGLGGRTVEVVSIYVLVAQAAMTMAHLLQIQLEIEVQNIRTQGFLNS